MLYNNGAVAWGCGTGWTDRANRRNSLRNRVFWRSQLLRWALHSWRAWLSKRMGLRAPHQKTEHPNKDPQRQRRWSLVGLPSRRNDGRIFDHEWPFEWKSLGFRHENGVGRVLSSRKCKLIASGGSWIPATPPSSNDDAGKKQGDAQ
jgi:hypothetical protein